MGRRSISQTAKTTAPGWRWALAGAVVGTMAALLLFAPARWLATAVREATHGHVLLLNPWGTVWDGSAAVVLASGAGGNESLSLPGILHWTLRPRWNGVAAALTLPCCTTTPLGLTVTPGVKGVQLAWQDGQSHWPAAVFAGLGAPWNTLRLDGTLALSTHALVMQWEGPRLSLAGQATLDANAISSSLSTLKPMGSYRLALEGGSAPSVLLSTLDGSLQLSGSGRWNGVALKFSGEASAAPGREAALSNLLNIIGRREGARSIITLG